MVFQEKEIKSTFIEIQAKNGRNIVVGSIYRLPNGKEGNFVKEMSELICKTKQQKKN